MKVSREFFSSEMEKLHKRYRELDLALENSYDGIMICNNKGIGLRVNPALLRVTGLEENQLVGSNIAELQQKGIVAYEPITIRALQEQSVITGMQKIWTGKKVTVTGVPVFGEGKKVIRVISNVRDVEALSQIQHQDKLNRVWELSKRYSLELATLKKELEKSDHIIACSPEMLTVMESVMHLAASDVNVMILGESGVGKDIIARLIHDNSRRNKCGKYIKVNCGAIPYELMESEFFGYERGAFTGARQEGKRGFFELANGGTIFLDEIADLPLGLQVKLLRVLEDREIIRVGGENAIRLDVRVIAATNKNLEAMVAEGSFREDLYYRLNVVPMTLPPLRERPEDIVALLEHFLEHFNEKYGTNKSFSVEALYLLKKYSWPGNVRELINLVERLVITCKSPVILPEHFPRSMNIYTPESDSTTSLLIEYRYLREQLKKKNMKEILEEIERKIVLLAFKEHRSSRKVGEILGVSHATVINKLRKHGIID
ncbi:MAG: sigma 54-interacting transcriptional regulator [Bacillota bacterium]